MQVHLLERSQNNHIRELSRIVQNSLAINYGEFEPVVFLVAFGLATHLGISKFDLSKHLTFLFFLLFSLELLATQDKFFLVLNKC